jgi:hypothetical protein
MTNAAVISRLSPIVRQVKGSMHPSIQHLIDPLKRDSRVRHFIWESRRAEAKGATGEGPLRLTSRPLIRLNFSCTAMRRSSSRPPRTPRHSRQTAASTWVRPAPSPATALTTAPATTSTSRSGVKPTPSTRVSCPPTTPTVSTRPPSPPFLSHRWIFHHVGAYLPSCRGRGDVALIIATANC